MAAYAALVSLLNLTEEIQSHPRLSTSLEKQQIEFLGQNVKFLLDFIESYTSHGGRKEAEVLESQIASAAYRAVDVIESHIVDQIHDGFRKRSPTCLLALRKVIVDMDSIKEKVRKVKEECGFKEKQRTYSMRATSSRNLTTGKTSMVGFDDELTQLMDVLTGQQSSRQIIQIIGMGGIGKTTLARNVYEHLLIVQHFDVCLWATISQDYSVKEILLQLLSRQGKSTGETVHELGEQLHKSLWGRRYLIVLDDMWSTDAWDEIKLFFPDNGNRSRIVITTRISNMAFDFSSCPFVMNFMDENKSWKLFCEKAFGGEGCPTELEGIGKTIVKNCKGLPLSIVVIGGHLRNSSRTKGYWENVANDINSVLDSGEDQQCLSILSLSYSNLPVHLKPCFLYMGIFPEYSVMCVSRLIELWIAERFLKPSEVQSIEEVAEVYLMDLIDRNLILVHEWSLNGKIKTCKIHDLLRELCLRVAKKEKFVCDSNLPPRPIKRRLLKIKIVDSEELHEFDENCLQAKFQQVNLRYIYCFFYFRFKPLPYLNLPSSIFLLWNLQTLIINISQNVRIIAPSEIWEMPQLRHVKVNGICLPDPPSDHQDDFVLQNLQTLSKVENFRLSEEACKRIPHIKRLGILYNGEASSSSYYCLNNLGRFKRLKSLTCDFDGVPNLRDFPLNLPFPSSLKKLCLSCPCLNWEDLTIIALSLPHLEVLKLNFSVSAIGQFEGEFPRLKCLTIGGTYDFIYWNAESSHFPVLEILTLGGLSALAEIPSGIGEIPTLRCIALIDCSVSAAVSAKRILVEQQSYGNEGLQLQVMFRDPKDVERIWEIIQEEDLTRNNLRLNLRGIIQME